MKMWNYKDNYLNLGLVGGKYQIRGHHPIYTDDLAKAMAAYEDKATAEDFFNRTLALFEKTKYFDAAVCNMKVRFQTLLKVLIGVYGDSIELHVQNRITPETIKIWTIDAEKNENGYCYYSLTDSLVWQCSQSWYDVLNELLENVQNKQSEVEAKV